MSFYDVIIIGSGPAGLNCAKFLSDKQVLLLEQNSNIGQKVCAGGLTSKSFKYLNLPNQIIDHKFNKITINTLLTKKTITYNQNLIYTIDRENLAKHQLNQLKNITIKTKSRVTKIKKDHIIVNNCKKIRFNYLVGADGSTSIVRKHLKLKTNNQMMAIQYLITTKKFKNLKVFFNTRYFNQGYAWIFPHKNYVSIGTGCNPKYFSPIKLKTNLDKWLKKKKINLSKTKYQAFPINFDYQGHKFKNIFLVGDAAGLASGISGEGIYQALISGQEVAKHIINKNYVSRPMKHLISLHKSHCRIANFLSKSLILRQIEYELISFLLNNKKIRNKVLSTLI